MIKPGDHGNEVLALQVQLLRLGCKLPRFGSDGWYGDETVEAVEALMSARSRVWTDGDIGRLSDEDVAWLMSLSVETPRLPRDTFDLRGSHRGVKRVRRRRWAEVTGITLHQTACKLGEIPARWSNVGCHLGITRQGKTVLLNDLDWVVVHGNGFNSTDVGIEMDGHYAGVEGDLSTYWRPDSEPNRAPLHPTDELVRAACESIRWVVAEVRAHGGELRYLHAHRQAKAMRQSDPGSELWQRVAMPMMRELGLTDGGNSFKVGNGRPIPRAWDPARTADY